MVDPQINQNFKSEIQKKIKKIDELISQSSTISGQLNDISSSFGKVSRYLEKVVINGEQYDKGEFKSNSSELEKYSDDFNSIKSELQKIQGDLKAKLKSINYQYDSGSTGKSSVGTLGYKASSNMTKDIKLLE